LFKIIFYRCKRFNTNQSKEQVRSQEKGARRKPKAALVWRTRLSGVPLDSVRCTTGQCPVHQGASARTLHLRVSQAPLRYNSPDMSGAHRTVQCTSGATAICTQRSTLQSEQCKSDVRADGQRGTGLSGVAPDCPVPHEDKASNGRPALRPNGRMTWRRTGHCPVAHRTVRCVLRQQTSPTARFWLVAINTTPTGHFKVWEPKQHSKSSS
jgi:hypothetical protein